MPSRANYLRALVSGAVTLVLALAISVAGVSSASAVSHDWPVTRASAQHSDTDRGIVKHPVATESPTPLPMPGTHTGLSPMVAVPLGVLIILVGSTLWLIVRWRRTTRVDKAPVVDRQETPSNSQRERSNIS